MNFNPRIIREQQEAKLKGAGKVSIPPNSTDPNTFRLSNHIPRRINLSTHTRERHLPKANFIGPNTDVERRLRENAINKSIPVNRVDDAAREHDKNYWNIREDLKSGFISEKTAKKKVREADNLLLAKARVRKNNLLNPIEAIHGKAVNVGISAKITAEKLNLIDELKYLGLGRRDLLKNLRKKSDQ